MPASRPSRREARARTPFADNWRTILLVDALVGVLVLAGGVVLMAFGHLYSGAGIGAVGLTYDWLVYRRYRAWAEQRRQAGLDP